MLTSIKLTSSFISQAASGRNVWNAGWRTNSKDHKFRCGPWPTKFTSPVITFQSQSVKRESTFWNNCSLQIPPPSPPLPTSKMKAPCQEELLIWHQELGEGETKGGGLQSQLLFSFTRKENLFIQLSRFEDPPAAKRIGFEKFLHNHKMKLKTTSVSELVRSTPEHTIWHFGI